MRRLLTSVFVFFILIVCMTTASADVERRKDQFGKEFGYYIYPLVGEIPGLGTAAGAGASILNIAGNDADVTAYFLEGDFKAKGAALLDYHLSPRRLILDVGYNDYFVAPVAYNRGIDSDPDDVIYPEAEGRYILGQLTLTFDERRYEVYARVLLGRDRLHEVLDSDKNAFAGIDTEWNDRHPVTLGGIIDQTDDRLDPRRGVRFEFSARLPSADDPDESEYYVTDFNLTGYLPLRRWDTLVFNLFHSRAIVVNKGETDFATLQQESGLNCNQYPAGTERENCLATEEQFINNTIANNRYGTATSLGGTQRLRSYGNYRYYASKALSYGVEYRWNLTDEHTPFDIFIARGVRTGIQLAAFWERGMVAEHVSDLLDDGRDSYGVGFRLILSGVIIRIDYANGDEGSQSQLFITYPWSMFSVDNPG